MGIKAHRRGRRKMNINQSQGPFYYEGNVEQNEDFEERLNSAEEIMIKG
jgi:hypothetical protein